MTKQAWITVSLPAKPMTVPLVYNCEVIYESLKFKSLSSPASPSPELDSKTSGPVWRGIQLQPGGLGPFCFLPSLKVCLGFSSQLNTPPRLLLPEKLAASPRLSCAFKSRRWRWSNNANVSSHHHHRLLSCSNLLEEWLTSFICLTIIVQTVAKLFSAPSWNSR